MNKYQDIHIDGSDEVSVNSVINKVAEKLHYRLVETRLNDISISFPKSNNNFFGNIVRIIGSENSLNILNSNNWLKSLSGYILINPVKDIPKDHKYCSVRLSRKKNSKLAWAKRYSKRHNITFEEAINKWIEPKLDDCSLPFLISKSSSTGQKYSRFIKQSEEKEFVSGSFNTFGLSKIATIPIF
jgi:CRISPR-associated endonuclease Csy4